MADPAIQIWVWVASFLGSLAQEGETLGFAHDLGWRGCFFMSERCICAFIDFSKDDYIVLYRERERWYV